MTLVKLRNCCLFAAAFVWLACAASVRGEGGGAGAEDAKRIRESTRAGLDGPEFQRLRRQLDNKFANGRRWTDRSFNPSVGSGGRGGGSGNGGSGSGNGG